MRGGQQPKVSRILPIRMAFRPQFVSIELASHAGLCFLFYFFGLPFRMSWHFDELFMIWFDFSVFGSAGQRKVSRCIVVLLHEILRH